MLPKKEGMMEDCPRRKSFGLGGLNIDRPITRVRSKRLRRG